MVRNKMNQNNLSFLLIIGALSVISISYIPEATSISKEF